MSCFECFRRPGRKLPPAVSHEGLAPAATKDFKTYRAFQRALADAGIAEDVRMIFGVDATKSNANRAALYGGRGLHDGSRAAAQRAAGPVTTG
jgi:hypothetical protein